MHVALDIRQDSAGRLFGTAGRTFERQPLSFSGRMELLARVEQLCDGSSDSAPGGTGDGGGATQEEPSGDGASRTAGSALNEDGQHPLPARDAGHSGVGA